MAQHRPRFVVAVLDVAQAVESYREPTRRINAARSASADETTAADLGALITAFDVDLSLDGPFLPRDSAPDAKHLDLRSVDTDAADRWGTYALTPAARCRPWRPRECTPPGSRPDGGRNPGRSAPLGAT
ncbi:hypothetical protein OH807_40865 [Kitasatospora sp. NBC_01560]|uniref:hypothetical protein n=1 Tax=Kitasatospora sp. NBC_01560 TaxID=2975965 RepID=UPI0038665260